MVWTISTPTPEEGAALTGWTPEQWQEMFGAAYWRSSLFMLNALGVDTRQFKDENWGSGAIGIDHADSGKDTSFVTVWRDGLPVGYVLVGDIKGKGAIAISVDIMRNISTVYELSDDEDDDEQP